MKLVLWAVGIVAVFYLLRTGEQPKVVISSDMIASGFTRGASLGPVGEGTSGENAGSSPVVRV